MDKSFTGSKYSLKNQSSLLAIILLTGIFLRLFHYFNNRSLWEDEVFLASSLIKMNFIQLATVPLDYQQRAPVGFLWLVRFSVVLFNKKELALRLFPLISGVASLFVFIPVARFFLKSTVAEISAVAIVALAPPLIYHSVEVKQYGVEFFATVLSLFFYIKYRKVESTVSLISWGLLGSATLWFSFSSLFVLGGLAIGISLTCLVRREWRRFFLYLIPFSIWLVSFLVLYIFFISKYPDEEWLVQFWRNREAFMPLPPKSANDLFWFFKQIYSLIRYPIGLSWYDLDYVHSYSQTLRVLARMPFLPILLGLFGLRELWIRNKAYLLLFGLPVLLALLASSLELYPLRERLTLFLAPIFILVIAKGIDFLVHFKISASALNIIVVFLISAPLMNSILQFVNPDLFGDYKKSRQREAMQFAEKEYKKGDVVYVYWNNLPSFLYYQEAYGFKFKSIYGSDARLASTGFPAYFKNLSADFGQISGNQRLWYFFKPYNGMKIGDIENHPDWYYRNVDAVGLMLRRIAGMGTIRKTFPEKGLPTDVRVCLFDLKQ
jgi:hypothetical protein